jgi:hypothetical protein
MSEGVQTGSTTQFVLLAVKHDAAYWTPHTLAQELHTSNLLASPSEAELEDFTKTVLGSLVGRAAEKFWASDAVTPRNAAAIRSACGALHRLTFDEFTAAVAELHLEGSPSPDSE